MKPLFLSMLLLAFGATVWAQAEMEISTMRVGPFRLKMQVEEAAAIAGRALVVPGKQNDYNGTTIVKYNNELVEISIADVYVDEAQRSYEIYSIATQSPEFKTRSGLGIGSTREQLLEAYKNFSSFSVYPGWTNDGKRSATESYFMLQDTDADTQITFRMRNNIVVEVTVSVAYEGC